MESVALHEFLRRFPIDDLRFEAHSNLTEEICGVCLKDGRFIRAENLAPDKTSHFMFDRALIDKHEDEVLAIFHTHILESDGSVFSAHDIEISRSLEIPYLLYNPIDDGWDYFDPMGPHPYPLEAEGSPEDLAYYCLWRFDYARADCASTVRGWYQGKLGIRLEDYNRIDLEAAIEHRLDQFGPGRWIQNGFKILDKDTPLKDHDIVAIDFAGIQQAHHLGVIVSAEENMMLHNLGRDRFSEAISYSDSWRDRTFHVARHESQL